MLRVDYKGGLSLDVKIYSQNTILKNPPKEPAAEGALWRGWKIQLVAVDGTRELEGLLSEIVDYVEYILHPTFENPRRGRMSNGTFSLRKSNLLDVSGHD